MRHSSFDFRKNIGNYASAGENLMQACTDDVPTNANESWWSEIHCTKYSKVGDPCGAQPLPNCDYKNHAEGIMVGHFTQLAWESSTHIGCAYVHCDVKCRTGSHTVLLGCMYGKGGNIVGLYPFKELVARKMQSQNEYILPSPPNDKSSREQCTKQAEKYKQLNPRIQVFDRK